MQKWAERIKELLLSRRLEGLTQTGLARACGIAQPSVSQWFNDNDTKPATEMIRGDNLIAAARYLGTTPEWVITGKGPRELSQTVGLHTHKLEVALISVRKAMKSFGLEWDAIDAAAVVSFAYRELGHYPDRLSRTEISEFDSVVKHKLRGGTTNEEAERSAPGRSTSGNQENAPTPAKARRGVR